VQDGRLRFANPAFAGTFGIPVDDALRSDFDLARIFEPSSAALAAGRIAAWERGETAHPVEILGKTCDGQVRHLELRGSRIEYAGRPAAECLLVDMTEAKRLRERLSESEKLRALGELAGGVAHDFNNLLGAILGRVQLLRRRAFAGEVDQDLAVIEKAAQDGRETVRRIQEFSRTRRDRPFQHVDLSEILRDAAEMTRTRWKADAEHRNITVHLELDTPETPPVLGSAAELREVFTNLVLNAVDAMPQGGRLRLACRQRGERVFAEVSDTGVGMTEEIRRQLFNPFFTTKGSGGMGLGLSVAYGIVTRHGGHIDVTTALGRGTTFLLEFPVAEGAPMAVGGDGAAMPSLVRPGRILVIDDEPEIAEVVREVLASEGHTVETALSGNDGVALARLTAYDLVFTDLGMPDMSGWEVAERIARLRPGMPVALVTGWGATLDHAEIRRRGIAAVVHKPFEIEELIRVATGVLSRRQASAVPE
jgi:PAS domain S-box-containing protein